ncbi:MAG: hypothetical protein ACKVIF_00945 [Rhodospirillales bacterium]|jgi:hypothetical protein
MNSDLDVGRNHEAIDAAMSVMAAHIDALNAGNETALTATLHFPHYRLSDSNLKTWEGPDDYWKDFLARAGDGWHHTVWDSLDVITAEPKKVHLNVSFTRYRKDDTVLSQFGSIWVITKLNETWAAQLRSSFAP